MTASGKKETIEDSGIKPICIIEVRTHEYIARGNDKAVLFIPDEGEQFILLWDEIYNACKAYQDAKENHRRTYGQDSVTDSSVSDID